MGTAGEQSDDFCIAATRRRQADPNSNRAKAAKDRNHAPCAGCQRSRQKCEGGPPCARCVSLRKDCAPGTSSICKSIADSNIPPEQVFVQETGKEREKLARRRTCPSRSRSFVTASPLTSEVSTLPASPVRADSTPTVLSSLEGKSTVARVSPATPDDQSPYGVPICESPTSEQVRSLKLLPQQLDVGIGESDQGGVPSNGAYVLRSPTASVGACVWPLVSTYGALDCPNQWYGEVFVQNSQSQPTQSPVPYTNGLQSQIAFTGEAQAMSYSQVYQDVGLPFDVGSAADTAGSELLNGNASVMYMVQSQSASDMGSEVYSNQNTHSNQGYGLSASRTGLTFPTLGFVSGVVDTQTSPVSPTRHQNVACVSPTTDWLSTHFAAFNVDGNSRWSDKDAQASTVSQRTYVAAQHDPKLVGLVTEYLGQRQSEPKNLSTFHLNQWEGARSQQFFPHPGFVNENVQVQVTGQARVFPGTDPNNDFESYQQYAENAVHQPCSPTSSLQESQALNQQTEQASQKSTISGNFSWVASGRCDNHQLLSFAEAGSSKMPGLGNSEPNHFEDFSLRPNDGTQVGPNRITVDLFEEFNQYADLDLDGMYDDILRI